MMKLDVQCEKKYDDPVMCQNEFSKLFIYTFEYVFSKTMKAKVFRIISFFVLYNMRRIKSLNLKKILEILKSFDFNLLM